MHSEWFDINDATVKRLNQAKANGQRIIAVGTIFLLRPDINSILLTD